MLSKKKLPKSLAVSILFLTFAPTSVNCLYGERRKCSMFRLSLFMEKRSFALFLTHRNLDNFKHSQDIATMDAHASSLYQAILLRTLLVCLFQGVPMSRIRIIVYTRFCVGSALPVQLCWVVQNLDEWSMAMSGSTLLSFIGSHNIRQ